MRLDELVGLGFQLLVVGRESKTGNCNVPSNVSLTCLVNTLVASPQDIATVSLIYAEKKEKKLRPWTMEEFEKHRDEWFVNKNNIRFKVNSYSRLGVTVCFATAPVTLNVISWAQLCSCNIAKDGSPCGVLE